MSGYGQGKGAQYAAELQNEIADFMANYAANPSDQHTTIFLFPGGFASALVRAREGAAQGPPYTYDNLWLTCSIVSGAAIDLQMQGDEDYQDRYILPKGCIDFLTLRPYGAFADWCRQNAIDLFIFGWDWRCSTADAADFFLQTFLPEFEARTGGLTPPALDNFWLIGHSFGGGVIKQILNQHANPYVQRLRGAITVGSPFYGYGGQLHRFFVGESDLNSTEGVQGASIITEINATLRAGYELLFLDQNTFNANQNAFAHDPEGYNLNAYPSADATTGAEADPYNPVPGQPAAPPQPTDWVRYLPNGFFKWSYLSLGHAASLATAAPLDASVAGKFWNIRGVIARNGAATNSTPVSQTWAKVQASCVPDPYQDPITDALGAGDDTIPAWSARLLGNANVVTVAGRDIEHMDLMNNGSVQAAIARVLFPAGVARRRMLATARTRKMPAASRKDLDQFLGAVRSIDRGLSGEDRTQAVRRALKKTAKGDPDKLPQLLVRAYMDALKSPSQKLGRGRGSKTRSEPASKRRK